MECAPLKDNGRGEQQQNSFAISSEFSSEVLQIEKQ